MNIYIYKNNNTQWHNRLYKASKSRQYSPAQIKAQLIILEAKKTAISTIEADIIQLSSIITYT